MPSQDFFHFKMYPLQDLFLVKLLHQYQEFLPNSQKVYKSDFGITTKSLNRVDNTLKNSNIFISHKITLTGFEDV